MWGPGRAGCSRLTQLHGGASSKELGCEVPVGPQASPVEGAAGGPGQVWVPQWHLSLHTCSCWRPPTAPNPTLNAPRRPQLCPDARERLLEL